MGFTENSHAIQKLLVLLVIGLTIMYVWRRDR